MMQNHGHVSSDHAGAIPPREAADPIADVDGIARPVVALAATVVGKTWQRARHHHRKAQLLYVVRGLIRCQVEGGLWIVPPQCAVWIPGGLPHTAQASTGTECYGLFVEPDAASDLPHICCTLAVSPLLRELVHRAAEAPRLYDTEGVHGRLIATLLDELRAASVEDLKLPLPRDPRLRALADLLFTRPGARVSVAQWAHRIGMSERSMTRLLSHELGMSFGGWRRQLHVVLALQRLARGERVQTIALDLGYENASSFIAMFRKAVGQPPARYLSDRKLAALPASGHPTMPVILLLESFQEI